MTLRFAALRAPAYRSYFVLNLIAMAGDNIEHVISYWVIFQAFHSPALGGFAIISHWVPFLLFSLHAGALADRYDCRTLIQISQGLYMLASLAWGLLFLTGTLEMWHAVVILLVHGAAGVVGAPASQLILHDMVAPEQLPSAIRLNATSRHLSILLGPAIGGGLMLLLGPAGGLLANVLVYVPFTIFLLRTPYTGHLHQGDRRAPRTFGYADALNVLAQARADRRLLTMMVLAGVTSFFVGNAFQAQMPEYAHHLGTDEGGAKYSMLLAGNAAGAVIGALALESVAGIRPSARIAIVCAGLWAVTIGLFPMAGDYGVALGLLVLAGVFNITFASMAQTLVQTLAPPRLRGALVGLFNTAILGLRFGSGLTVGVLGAVIGVRRSLELSALVVALIAAALFVRDATFSRPDARRSEGAG